MELKKLYGALKDISWLYFYTFYVGRGGGDNTLNMEYIKNKIDPCKQV